MNNYPYEHEDEDENNPFRFTYDYKSHKIIFLNNYKKNWVSKKNLETNKTYLKITYKIQFYNCKDYYDEECDSPDSDDERYYGYSNRKCIEKIKNITMYFLIPEKIKRNINDYLDENSNLIKNEDTEPYFMTWSYKSNCYCLFENKSNLYTPLLIEYIIIT